MNPLNPRRTAALACGIACLAGLSPMPASASPSPYAPGTTISHRTSQQVMVADRTRGTHGTWARWEWRGSRTGWVRVNGRAGAVFGRGGVVPAARRVQNTNTTPAGTFGLVTAFGVGNPGTRMPYRRITPCSWWDENPTSRLYNRWVETCSRRLAHSEHLADYSGSLYRQGVVLNYNYARRTRYGHGSGAGIFLHFATRHTGGCVGLDSMAELTRTVQWLDPVKHPVIVVTA